MSEADKHMLTTGELAKATWAVFTRHGVRVRVAEFLRTPLGRQQVESFKRIGQRAATLAKGEGKV